MNFLYLACVGALEPDLFRGVSDFVARMLGLPVRLGKPLDEPPDAYDPVRRQCSSTAVLKHLAANIPDDALCLLGITGKDIFIPMLSFVYGQAQLGGKAALISIARLDQQFYGLPANRPVLLNRACKEALHELGHVFSLVHCSDRSCVMSLSTNIRQVDLKRDKFCRGCYTLLAERLVKDQT